jgi:AAA15 family ATPase/GTPase
MYIKKIVLENIRCFEHIEIEFDLSGKMPPWTVVVGDNAAGKTTLLRSIAIGLCDESSAAGLLKESDSGYVRYGEKEGSIIIDLVGDTKKYQIKTTIEHIKINNGYFERVRQETISLRGEKFPWHKLFVAGYGAGRGTSGTGDVAGYSVINAVYNMFNYAEGLQNPELTIRRFKNIKTQDEAKKTLQEMLDVNKIDWDKSGITIDGKWGKKMPLRDLADGYKTTFLWITDLLGWAVSFYPKTQKSSSIKGIVLVDEIEQHLHPKWQEEIIKQLKTQFPQVQFITTTHSPLVASSFGTLTQKDIDKRILLSLSTKKGVTGKELPRMVGWRVDQTLASEAFEYQITGESEELSNILYEASILHNKDRSPQEEKRYVKITEKIASIRLSSRQTEVEDEIDKKNISNKLEQIHKREKKLFGADNDKNRTLATTNKAHFQRRAAKKKKR